MNQPNQNHTAEVREATRRLVREFDVFRNIRPELDISLSQCHALIEMQKSGSITVGELTKILGLNKSTVSRLLTKLHDSGYIYQIEHDSDSRSKPYALTEEGVSKLAKIDEHASERVENALALLDETSRNCVIEGMNLYAAALRQTRVESEQQNRTTN